MPVRYYLIALICRAFTLNISGSLDSILNTMSLIWSDLKAKCEKFFSPSLLVCGGGGRCEMMCVRSCVRARLCLFVCLFANAKQASIQRNLLKNFHYDCGQISLSNGMNEVLKRTFFCSHSCQPRFNVKLAINSVSKLLSESGRRRRSSEVNKTTKQPQTTRSHRYDIQAHQFCILKDHII